MIIGIDIDDVVTDSSELITEYAKKYFEIDSVELINNILHAHDVNDKVMDFYNKYLIEMQQNYKLKDNVKEVIDRLRSKGNKVIFITARGSLQQHKSLEQLDQIKVTKEYLNKHEINVDKIVFRAYEKRTACIENNLDIMIDDSIKILESLKETSIKPLLFNSISNQNFKTNFDKIFNWLELERFINKEQEK